MPTRFGTNGNDTVGAHTAMAALLSRNFALADRQGVAANQLNSTHFLV